MKLVVDDKPKPTKTDVKNIRNGTVFTGVYDGRQIVGMKSVMGDKLIWVDEYGKVNSCNGPDALIFGDVKYNVKVER